MFFTKNERHDDYDIDAHNDAAFDKNEKGFLLTSFQ
jgi:hypothetical protein